MTVFVFCCAVRGRSCGLCPSLQLGNSSSSECKSSACVYQQGGVGGDQVISLVKPDTTSSPPVHFQGRNRCPATFFSKMSSDSTNKPRVCSCLLCKYMVYHNTASGYYIYIYIYIYIYMIISELTVKQMCNIAYCFVWICTLVCHAENTSFQTVS